MPHRVGVRATNVGCDNRSVTPRNSDLTGKTVVITGANSGIGKETAIVLARLGASVTMVARNPVRAEEAVAEIRRRSGSDQVRVEQADLSNLDSVRAGAEALLANLDEIHVLVNNAGVIADERRETAQGFEEMFGVNHLGHFLLTDLLTERLVASAPARVVIVSSVAHRFAPRGLRFDDLQSARRFAMFPAYGRSKLANAMHALELARRLDGTGVTVNCLHPGTISSGFGGDGDTRLLGRLISGVGRLVMSDVETGCCWRRRKIRGSPVSPVVTSATADSGVRRGPLEIWRRPNACGRRASGWSPNPARPVVRTRQRGKKRRRGQRRRHESGPSRGFEGGVRIRQGHSAHHPARYRYPPHRGSGSPGVVQRAGELGRRRRSSGARPLRR